VKKNSHEGTGLGLVFWWVFVIIIYAFSYTLQRSVALLGLDLHHDLFMYDSAVRLLQGSYPYKDFFYQYNLATVFFHAFSLLFGGFRISALKIETAISFSLIAVFVYLISALASRRREAFVAALLWASLSPFYMPMTNGYHPWSTVYMMMSVMIGVYALLCSVLGERKQFFSIIAGICFALAFWFKQVAAIQIVIVSVWIAAGAIKNSSSSSQSKWIRVMTGYFVGLLMGSLPFVYYLVSNGLVSDWLNCAFLFNGYFAASGGSATGLKFFIMTILPVSKDLGYQSLIWLLLPITVLLALFIYKDRGGAGIILRKGGVENPNGIVMSLLAAVSLAGWVEYFPLAHSFHTQLFMAPAFSLLAISTGEIIDRKLWTGRYLLLSFVLAITVADGFYEAVRHLHGFTQKVSEPRVRISGYNPAAGLLFFEGNSNSFRRYYQRLLLENKRYKGRVLPMSVDPLRALIPYSVSWSRNYKMGVDWSWPNEIVEPGFNDRLAKAVAERNSLIYADSPVAIPGYTLAAILEMPSPITMTHTLYVPSADSSVVLPDMTEINKMETVSGYSISKELNARTYRLIPVNKDIAAVGLLSDLHVSMVKMSDLPKKIKSFEYEKFFRKFPEADMPDFGKIYQRNRNGNYVMLDQPDKSEMVRFARFLLIRGKIFPEQNRPVYNSTMMIARDSWPLLASECGSCGNMSAIWMKALYPGDIQKPVAQETVGPVYLGVPSDFIVPEDEIVFYVQSVSNTGITWNGFMHYMPVKK
jgi:hypothetical protein